jgi:hypothetical protein
MKPASGWGRGVKVDFLIYFNHENNPGFSFSYSLYFKFSLSGTWQVEAR